MVSPHTPTREKLLEFRGQIEATLLAGGLTQDKLHSCLKALAILDSLHDLGQTERYDRVLVMLEAAFENTAPYKSRERLRLAALEAKAALRPSPAQNAFTTVKAVILTVLIATTLSSYALFFLYTQVRSADESLNTASDQCAPGLTADGLKFDYISTYQAFWTDPSKEAESIAAELTSADINIVAVADQLRFNYPPAKAPTPFDVYPGEPPTVARVAAAIPFMWGFRKEHPNTESIAKLGFPVDRNTLCCSNTDDLLSTADGVNLLLNRIVEENRSQETRLQVLCSQLAHFQTARAAYENWARLNTLFYDSLSENQISQYTLIKRPFLPVWLVVRMFLLSAVGVLLSKCTSLGIDSGSDGSIPSWSYTFVITFVQIFVAFGLSLLIASAIKVDLLGLSNSSSEKWPSIFLFIAFSCGWSERRAKSAIQSVVGKTFSLIADTSPQPDPGRSTGHRGAGNLQTEQGGLHESTS
ncbi:MAG TPA: hypothetical protein VGO93_01945 [Candidatus Xenobia bacterium]|jgi:hypothetical protein